MRRMLITTAIALLATGLVSSASAQTITLTVDCAKGQKIADAITRGDVNRPLTIIVRGTCTESVVIARDDLVLQGGTLVGADPNAPTVTVRAIGVTISGMTISGGSNGVSARRQSEVGILGGTIQNTASHAVRAINAAVRIRNVGAQACVIENAGGNGVSAEMASSVNVSGCQIQNNAAAGIYAQSNSAIDASGNTIAGNRSSGVFLEFGSSGIVNGNTITNNSPNGVFLFGSAHANMNANTITGSEANGLGMDRSDVEGFDNVISGSKASGVAATASQLALWGGSITGNGGDGMDLSFGSYLLLDGTDVSGNALSGVALQMNSTAKIMGATVSNNVRSGIYLSLSSKLFMSAPATTATGNGSGFGLKCADAESSVLNAELVLGDKSPACTGY
jgi:parallel beta-helix repeat protein